MTVDTIAPMPERRSPTLRRRRLSAELRRLRAEKSLSVIEVAEQANWSEAKQRWIEDAQWVRPNPRDVQDLLDIYGVTDTREREELLRWAREGRQKGWWHAYREMLSERYSTYIGLEAEAAEVLTFELAVIPGLAQTEAYARALIKEGPAEIDKAEIEKRVEIRVERQQILIADDPVSLQMVIDEAALHRPVGGPKVMREQIQRLIELANLPHVIVQLLPYDAGPHPGTGGPFTILSFEGDPAAVYVPTIAGELLIEEAKDVKRYERVFRRLIGKALSPEATISKLATEVAGT
ncbi:helix-turn-helix transcriptional regulator [Actinoallomurus liliacearum]|uniref:Helix-turn-helix transcriptional regulator n=2 Tax=Thermomonosporaceae TaxID=2012 RepID=A0ABP8TKQ6_9ACTN